MANPSVEEKIKAAAEAKGIPPELALRIANSESSNTPSAKNPRSTAGGLFQVVDQTWKDYKGAPGKKYNVDENIRVGTDIIADNLGRMKKLLNREPSFTDVYAAHYFGPTTARDVINASPSTPTDQLFDTKVLKANPNLQGKTAGDVIAMLDRKMGVAPAAVAAKPAPASPAMPMQAAGAAASSTPKAPAPRVLSQATPTPAVSRETMLAALGPGYQAAVALSYLADNTDEDDPDIQAFKERTEPGPGAQWLAEKSKPSPFASLDLSVKSPFAEPVARMSHGGAVHRADGSPPEGEKPQVDNTASAKAAAMLRGFGDSAYSIAGAPVDLATMAMRPFGYNVEKPILGSDWIKQKAEEYGIRPGNEVDPQLNRLRQGSEFVSSFVNPAVPVRAAAAATTKSAEMLKGLSKAEPALNLAQRETPALTSLSSMAVNKGATVTPFYSKLDEQAQTLTGPIAPAEFIKQLQNKGFRGYEIERAKEAMKSLGDQRVEPAQILGALDKTYHPENYITHISEPGTVGHTYPDVDNVLRGLWDKQPQGVVSLHLPVTEEMGNTKKLYDHLEDMRVLTPKVDSTAIKSTNIMDTITNAYKLIEKEHGADSPITKKATNTFLHANKMAKEKAPFMELIPEYTKLKNEFMYPMQEGNAAVFSQLVDKKVKDIRTKIATIKDNKPDRDFVDALNQLGLAEGNNVNNVYGWATQQVVHDLRAETGRKLVPLLRQMGFKRKNELDFFKNPINANEKVWQGKTMMEMEFSTKENVLNNDLAAFQDSVKHGLGWFQKNLPRRLMPETRHAELFADANMKPRPNTNPVAFSRFTDTSTQLNGQKLNGMFVPELQSDLLRSVRERGQAGKSVSDDLPKINKITEELYAAEKEMQQLQEKLESGNLGAAYDPWSTNGDNLGTAYIKARDKYNSLGAKLQAIGDRTYDVTPAFAGMEDSPQVVQQLMAKNVVLSGIKRNKNYVAFPGAESDQAQIYEKLPRNLEQVVKDLGPGFELQMVEVPLPAGVHHTKLYKMEKAGTLKFPTDANGIVIKDAPPVMMAPAIVWGPEAAARIMKQGVRFNEGGMVERQPDDNRRYL
jgi:hypothetical protein